MVVSLDVSGSSAVDDLQKKGEYLLFEEGVICSLVMSVDVSFVFHLGFDRLPLVELHYSSLYQVILLSLPLKILLSLKMKPVLREKKFVLHLLRGIVLLVLFVIFLLVLLLLLTVSAMLRCLLSSSPSQSYFQKNWRFFVGFSCSLQR